MINLRSIILGNSWIELAARWILGLTFVYASFHKIISPGDFAKIVYGYDLFPAASINLIAIIVPFLELTAGSALIVGFYPRSAAIILDTLLLAFITLLTINLIRGHEYNCGCFSAGQNGHSTPPWLMLLRDVILFVLGAQIVLFKGSRKSFLGLLFYGPSG